MEDKASKRALEAYPKETRDIDGIVIDIGHPQYMRDLFIEGYHQAEKDMELTWEDIEAIDQIFTDVFKDGFDVITNKYYQEVLNRFKDLKHVK